MSSTPSCCRCWRLIFIFCYVPMYGIVIAFQKYAPGRPFLAFDGSDQVGGPEVLYRLYPWQVFRPPDGQHDQAEPATTWCSASRSRSSSRCCSTRFISVRLAQVLPDGQLPALLHLDGRRGQSVVGCRFIQPDRRVSTTWRPQWDLSARHGETAPRRSRSSVAPTSEKGFGFNSMVYAGRQR